MMQDSLQAKAGKNLKRLIKEHGLTQNQFADMIGTDPANLRKWLSHGINQLSTLEEIAKIFNIDVKDIL